MTPFVAPHSADFTRRSTAIGGIQPTAKPPNTRFFSRLLAGADLGLGLRVVVRVAH